MERQSSRGMGGLNRSEWQSSMGWGCVGEMEGKTGGDGKLEGGKRLPDVS